MENALTPNSLMASFIQSKYTWWAMGALILSMTFCMHLHTNMGDNASPNAVSNDTTSGEIYFCIQS